MMKLMLHIPPVEIMRNVLINGVVIVWSDAYLDETSFEDALRTGKFDFYANATAARIMLIIEDVDPQYNYYVVNYEATTVDTEYVPEMDVNLIPV